VANIVVVGVDGSETARKAAQTAAQLAFATGSDLHVVTAFEHDDVETVGIGADRWLLSAEDRARNTADEAADAARRTVPTVITSVAIQGRPAEALLAEAERLDAQVIVVGNRGMQGLGRVLGSVANTVSHRASCDVYIVKTV